MNIINENPSMYFVINKIFKTLMSDVNTIMPAIVDKFDADNKTVDVVPVFKKEYKNGEIIELPVIQAVPVVYMQTNNAIIYMPIQRGDIVLLVFSQRSMDEWKTKGGKLAPVDKRKHDLNDAIAIPGIFPLGQGFMPTKKEAVVIKHKNAEINIFEDNIEITGNSNVIINNGNKGVARLDDTTISNLTIDSTFFTWLTTTIKTYLDTHTHIGVLSGGAISGPPATPSPSAPSSLTSKINSASSTVKAGD